ncbi:MAG: hypothetical protein ACYTFW_00750 [Planctomycetota bacterium]|jgi:hypothetical protein
MGAIHNKDIKKVVVTWIAISLLGNSADFYGAEKKAAKWPSHIQIVLDETEPLKYDRGKRLPLYLWQAMDPGSLDEKTARELVEELNERGVGLITSWDPRNREKSLTDSMRIASAQKELDLRVNINATGCLYSFFNGDERTAHIDDEGRPFWDSSFGKKNMGCPFTLNFRRPHMREQVEYFVNAFNKADLDIDFVFADWEVDGPIEFNEAHAASKRCRRCRENIMDMDDFEHFQKVLRQLRCELQREVYAEPIKMNFPGALVGNYGIYPHNGYRYWYDYFEYYVDGQPYQADQRARYRKWYHEFPETGYTFAMPVVYTWRRIFDWYDYLDTDYRWFYNMLLVASNAGQHTPAEIPIISFVHWHTIESKTSIITARQFSETKYKELLWHMLLRGTDTFFLWSPRQQAAKEIPLVHQVYAEAQRYGEFLSKGQPISFSVPRQPGTVVSGLKLADRVLIRRTDFKENSDLMEITIDNIRITARTAPGRCQIVSLR